MMSSLLLVRRFRILLMCLFDYNYQKNKELGVNQDKTSLSQISLSKFPCTYMYKTVKNAFATTVYTKTVQTRMPTKWAVLFGLF